MADGMQAQALTPAELQGAPGAIQDAVIGGGFDTASPLWFYILREADVQQNGNRLGSVGSRIVAETLTALVLRDRASYANNPQDPAIKPNGIDVGGDDHRHDRRTAQVLRRADQPAVSSRHGSLPSMFRRRPLELVVQLNATMSFIVLQKGDWPRLQLSILIEPGRLNCWGQQRKS